MKVWVGIDPGQSGGIAIIHDEGDGDTYVTPMLIAGKDIDISATTDWIYDYVGEDEDVVVAIEKVHAVTRPGAVKQGVVSMFKFGFNTGVMHGVIGALGYRLYLVTPQAWKKAILAGTAKDKLAAIDYCRRAFPNVSLLATTRSTKPHSGMADALCIAAYAREKY